jgi:iron-sulfur cluster assembly accessory protein
MSANITLTDAAAKRIREILAGEEGKTALRLAVQGGGCSGFQYDFQIVEGPEEGDEIIERDGARLVIDPESLPFLLGATVDFEDTLAGSRFVVNNPNATSSCGCGVSFSI